MQVFENKVLRKIFGPKRDDENGEWRRLHNGELHDLYGRPDIMRIVKSRRLRWAGHVTRMGNERGAWKLLVGKPEEKRPVGRPRMRWENNINHDLREVDYTGDDWKSEVRVPAMTQIFLSKIIIKILILKMRTGQTN